jgi:hypothetical protein
VEVVATWPALRALSVSGPLTPTQHVALASLTLPFEVQVV